MAIRRPSVRALRFIVASWVVVHIDAHRVLEAHSISTGIGAPVVLRVRLVDGTSITLWLAMPALALALKAR